MTVRPIAAAVAVGFAILVSLWRPADTGGVMAGLEGRTLDARFALRGEARPPDSVAILAIDDATLGALETFPPPRDALARALDAARKGGASVIAFDLLLVNSGPGDAALATALQERDDAVLAISLSPGSETSEDPALRRAIARNALALAIGAPVAGPGPTRSLGPAPDLAARAALGHVDIAPEVDGALRRLPLVRRAGSGATLPALPLEAARRHAGLDRGELSLVWGKSLRFGGSALALDRHNEAGIAYYGPRGTIPTYPLAGAEAAPLDGRMVFIGATADGYGDTFPTPFDRTMPGVEALATVAANILEGTLLRRDDLTWLLDILLATVAALACFAAASRRRAALALALTLGTWAGALALVQGAFLRGLWLDGATLLLSMLVATLAGGAARWLLHRDKARNLARYQSPLLAPILADRARPAFDGRVQKAAALFVDAADFTGRTARLGPERTTLFLKAFHRCVERAAAATDGVVEQYAGDGAMICFGLPDPKPGDACNALDCAERLFAEIETLSASEIEAGNPDVSIRIGAHFGDVSAAILGGDNHGHVTFVGDVVNAASRLQEVAKQLKAELVVSGDLVAACASADGHGLFRHGPRLLRGRPEPLDIWIRPARAL